MRRDEAVDLQRQSGQERLLRVIGRRRAWRSDPCSGSSRRPTHGPSRVAPEERDRPRCAHEALEDEEVVYPGPIGQGQVAKFVLGPTVIAREDFEARPR